MRVFTEASIYLKGDEQAAKRNIGLARTLLGIMKSVNAKTNKVQRWRRKLPDGTLVDLMSQFGRDYIIIDSSAVLIEPRIYSGYQFIFDNGDIFGQNSLSFSADYDAYDWFVSPLDNANSARTASDKHRGTGYSMYDPSISWDAIGGNHFSSFGSLSSGVGTLGTKQFYYQGRTYTTTADGSILGCVVLNGSIYIFDCNYELDNVVINTYKAPSPLLEPEATEVVLDKLDTYVVTGLSVEEPTNAYVGTILAEKSVPSWGLTYPPNKSSFYLTFCLDVDWDTNGRGYLGAGYKITISDFDSVSVTMEDVGALYYEEEISTYYVPQNDLPRYADAALQAKAEFWTAFGSPEALSRSGGTARYRPAFRAADGVNIGTVSAFCMDLQNAYRFESLSIKGDHLVSVDFSASGQKVLTYISATDAHFLETCTWEPTQITTQDFGPAYTIETYYSYTPIFATDPDAYASFDDALDAAKADLIAYYAPDPVTFEPLVVVDDASGIYSGDLLTHRQDTIVNGMPGFSHSIFTDKGILENTISDITSQDITNIINLPWLFSDTLQDCFIASFADFPENWSMYPYKTYSNFGGQQIYGKARVSEVLFNVLNSDNPTGIYSPYSSGFCSNAWERISSRADFFSLKTVKGATELSAPITFGRSYYVKTDTTNEVSLNFFPAVPEEERAFYSSTQTATYLDPLTLEIDEDHPHAYTYIYRDNQDSLSFINGLTGSYVSFSDGFPSGRRRITVPELGYSWESSDLYKPIIGWNGGGYDWTPVSPSPSPVPNGQSAPYIQYPGYRIVHQFAPTEFYEEDAFVNPNAFLYYASDSLFVVSDFIPYALAIELTDRGFSQVSSVISSTLPENVGLIEDPLSQILGNSQNYRPADSTYIPDNQDLTGFSLSSSMLASFIFYGQQDDYPVTKFFLTSDTSGDRDPLKLNITDQPFFADYAGEVVSPNVLCDIKVAYNPEAN